MFLLTEKWIHARNLIATAVELNEAYQAVCGEQAGVGNEPTHVYGDPCPRSEGQEEYEKMLGITSEAEVPDEPADCLEKGGSSRAPEGKAVKGATPAHADSKERKI